MQAGDKYEVPFKVTADVYNGFIKTFKDNNPLHTDNAFAKARGFEGEVMHGNILNGFISYFIGECLPQKDVIIHSQSIKFSQPVYMDNELIFVASIVDFFESVNIYQFKFYFENAAATKVAKGEIQIGIL